MPSLPEETVDATSGQVGQQWMELGRMILHRSRHREITLVETIVPDLTLDLEWMRIDAKDPIIVKNAVALRST